MLCPKDRLVIEQEAAETVTPGGIVIPDKVKAKTAPRRGTVICAGRECKYVREGDQVLFDKEAVYFDGIPGENGAVTEYVFAKEDDILVIANRSEVAEPPSLNDLMK